MSYSVIKRFCDATDGYYLYKPGDKYPRAGYTPTPERVKALLGFGNALNMPLIRPGGSQSRRQEQQGENKLEGRRKSKNENKILDGAP